MKKGIVSKILCLAVSMAMTATSVPLDLYAAEPEMIEGELLDLSDSVEPLQEAPVIEEELNGEGESNQLEINQGLSIHTGLNDGNETLINDFVAKKQTIVMMKIPGSDSFTEDQAKSAVANYKLEAKAVTNGQEADNCELTASGENFSVKRAYTRDCDLDGWYAVASFPTGPDKGTYNFHLKDGDNEIAVNNGVNFYETTKLNILVAPVNGYWGTAYSGGAPSAGAYSCKAAKFSDVNGNELEWSSLTGELKKYLLDVYPIADVNFEEGTEIQANTADYDMCTDDGQKKLWEDACKLQSKGKDGKDRYDLILAFVQYRQDKGGGQGYTYGKPANIITYSDKDMLPTVAHEIAHCYQVGDEYNGGSFNNNVNYAPNGYSGRNFITGENFTSSGACDFWKTPKAYKESAGSGSKKSMVDVNGLGHMIYPSQHPYSLSQEKFISWGGVDPDTANATGSEVCPTISYMGSGYSGCDGYYWTTAAIWDHLFKQLVTKEKKEENTAEAESAETTNADVYLDAVALEGDSDENGIFDEDDFYYDDDVRWGDSRMIEVEGWLVKEGASVKVQMDPMYSFDGDLEYIEVLDDCYRTSNDVYTFAALNSEGKVIVSPVDGELAVAEFYGGFYNPRGGKGKDGMQNEVNFRFDAEYPKGTADFAIIKGNKDSIANDGTYAGEFLWRASTDENFAGDFEKEPEAYITYANVNSEFAEVDWDLYYPKGSENTFDNKDKTLYTEVYYCPEGDDGEAYYAGCSLDEGWTEGHISFYTDSLCNTKWTRNAYVWIKITNGINAVDIYSDENDVTLCNSVITLSGKGINKKTVDGQTVYEAECTGSAITPKVSVKAYDPSTGKYISLKNDVDFTVSYEDNIKVGTASVIVQGIGQYAGKNTQEFEIVKKQLSGTPELIPDVVYTADLDNAVLPYIMFKDSNNNQLTYGTDFTVKYTVDDKTETSLSKLITAEPENAVAVRVSYFGKGNYTGENKKDVSFNVVPASAGAAQLTKANTEVTLKVEAMQYTGKALKPAVKSVVYTDAEGNKTNLKSSEYKVVYTSNVTVGTARVTVVGAKGYAGSSYATFEITPKKVKSVNVSGIKNQTFTGDKIDVDNLPISVKAGGITLRKGIDYTVEAADDCDYTKVTSKADKKAGKQPKVIVKLRTLTEAEKATVKKSEQPRVEWADNVKDAKKVITVPFMIVSNKLTSSSVTLTTKKNEEAENKVKSADGSKNIATMRSATKEERKNKYAFVITGAEDALEKDADISEALSLKSFGKELKAGEDYTVTVSPTKAGKTGTITFKAKGDSLSGKRSVKFLYVKTAAEE